MTAPAAESLGVIAAEVRRVTDRLDGAAAARADAAAGPVRAVLQLLADAAQGIESRDDAEPPVSRPVPELPVGALGDQATVLGHDLAAAAAAAPGGPASQVWSAGSRTTIEDALAAVAEALTELRRTI